MKAIVDKEDFAFASQWQWIAKRNFQKKPIIIRTFGEHRTVYLHREIVARHNKCNGKIREIRHLNGDTLDNRLSNLVPKIRHQRERFWDEPHPQPSITPSHIFLNITRREEEIIKCVAVGFTNPEIAEHLHISQSTVACHIERICVKVDAKNRTELVYKLLKSGQNFTDDYVELPAIPAGLKYFADLHRKRLDAYFRFLEAKQLMLRHIAMIENLNRRINKLKTNHEYSTKHKTRHLPPLQRR